MVTVNVYELFDMVSQLIKDNVETVEIMDCDTFLSFEATEPHNTDYGEILDINAPDSDNSFSFSPDSIAPFVSTFKELALTHNAFLNTINCCLEELDSKTISAEDRSFLKTRLKELESYKNSLEAFLSKFQGSVKN